MWIKNAVAITLTIFVAALILFVAIGFFGI